MFSVSTSIWKRSRTGFLINEAKLSQAMQLLEEGIQNIPDDSTLKAMLEDVARDQWKVYWYV